MKGTRHRPGRTREPVSAVHHFQETLGDEGLERSLRAFLSSGERESLEAMALRVREDLGFAERRSKTRVLIPVRSSFIIPSKSFCSGGAGRAMRSRPAS